MRFLLAITLLVFSTAIHPYNNEDLSKHVVIVTGLSNTESGVRVSTGSGFFITQNRIVTSYHVIDSYQKIVVSAEGGEQSSGKLIHADRLSDVAIIEVKMKGEPVELAHNTSEYSRGNPVLVIGHPNGLYYSYTAGIISHNSRKLNHITNANYIQIDAPVNTGNSGSPVFVKNAVVGMVQTIISVSGGHEGVSMVYSTKSLIRILEKFQQTQELYMVYNYLGIISSEVVTLSSNNKTSVIISGIEAGSPAAITGLSKDDIILSINNQLVRTKEDYIRITQDAPKGAEITVVVRRNTTIIPFRLKLVSVS